MPDASQLTLFLTAAIALAITPGPGIFYVLTRSLKGGRQEGLASTLGTAMGGLMHVMAAALGLSALLATSAFAFALVKYAGAAYLVYLGIRTIRSRDVSLALLDRAGAIAHNGFRQGVVVEVLNPKTALFFLAFIPQFINPAGNVVAQFALLGSLSVACNTLADVIVVLLAGSIGAWLRAHPRSQQYQRWFTGSGLIGLGAYVALAEGDR